jgi:hypothetical protein
MKRFWMMLGVVGVIVIGLLLAACEQGNASSQPTKAPVATSTSPAAAPAAPPTAASSRVTPSTEPTKQTIVIAPGTAVIYLAGRSDVTIPPIDKSDPAFPISCRGELTETLPLQFAISPNATMTFSATGKINFFGGESVDGFDPDGSDTPSDINALGGISAYTGPQGSLVGVFLDNANPAQVAAPDAIDFSDKGVGAKFAKLTPKLGQVFFIGDGLTDTGKGQAQQFVAPTGATRLFIGFADASGFSGEPGCYGDNKGVFSVQVSSTDTFRVVPAGK